MLIRHSRRTLCTPAYVWTYHFWASIVFLPWILMCRIMPKNSFHIVNIEFIIRPPDVHVGGLIFYHWFYLLSFFFVSYSLCSLNGTQSKQATYSKVSAIWKQMSEIWVPPPHTNWGPKNHLFRGFNLRNLTATLTAYVFWTKHVIHNRASGTNCKGSPTSSQNDMNFGPQTASNWK